MGDWGIGIADRTIAKSQSPNHLSANLQCYTPATVPDVEIPKRALFKASEVCEIASVQPYVLRSWESEFPDLGVAKAGGGPRTYRRADVEKVLRIKRLVFHDGLTLAGVRRRIDEEAPPVLEEATAAPMEELLGRNAQERLSEVKKGLISILGMLNARPGEAPARPAARAPVLLKRTSRTSKPAAREPAAKRRVNSR
ncbi:MAG: MerR family transcriptional regulator [Acidobacteria bacterium]|nr:MerR family transcriptional regulator [Acidobacteriota bacterium]